MKVVLKVEPGAPGSSGPSGPTNPANCRVMRLSGTGLGRPYCKIRAGSMGCPCLMYVVVLNLNCEVNET